MVDRSERMAQLAAEYEERKAEFSDPFRAVFDLLFNAQLWTPEEVKQIEPDSRLVDEVFAYFEDRNKLDNGVSAAVILAIKNAVQTMRREGKNEGYIKKVVEDWYEVLVANPTEIDIFNILENNSD